MTNFTAAESALIRRYRDKITPIQDGFQENLKYLNAHFTLIECPLDQRHRDVLIENFQFSYPYRIEPFVFHSFTIQPETKEQREYFSKRIPDQDIFVILESHIGCVYCNYHRLSLELSIRNTISEEDIAAQNNIFRYRIFCFSELESLK